MSEDETEWWWDLWKHVRRPLTVPSPRQGFIVVLACGSRTFTSSETVDQTLDEITGRTRIKRLIHGAARGADLLAADWARRRGVLVRPFIAEWDRNGRAAGLMRNQRMLDEGMPHLVVAFVDPAGESRGTRDMVARSLRRGIPVNVILPVATP